MNGLLANNQGLMGLLANPMFQGGMGLLAAGQDGRINPFQSAMQGFGNAAQYQAFQAKQQREQEEQQRMDQARQQLQ